MVRRALIVTIRNGIDRTKKMKTMNKENFSALVSVNVSALKKREVRNAGKLTMPCNKMVVAKLFVFQKATQKYTPIMLDETECTTLITESDL